MDNYYVYCSDFNSATPLQPKAMAVAKLPQALSGGDYEIGLLEAHVCVAWANLTKAGLSLEKLDQESGLKSKIEFTLDDTIIDTADRLFLKINDAIEKQLIVGEVIDEWAKFGLTGRGNTKKIKIAQGVKATFSPNLTNLFGLNSNEIDNSTGVERMIVENAKMLSDFKFPSPWQHNIYVCCDGIKESFANNGILRTLGTIHINEDFPYGNYITVKFEKPIYRKWVGDGTIEEISISLIDELGDELLQRRGHVWGALHLRKISDASI